MVNRYEDWLRQADADLSHARNSLRDGDLEWCSFAAHQAAEKALKGCFLYLGMEAWGHTLSALVGNLPSTVELPAALVDYTKSLDKHYMLARYPNGFPSGAPTDFYTEAEAREAVRYAEAVLEFCRRQIG